MKAHVLAAVVALGLAMPVGSVCAGYEFICDGAKPYSQHAVIEVDCSDRTAVLDILRSAGIGGPLGNMCWESYNDIQELHPGIPLKGIAATMFIKCNLAKDTVGVG